MQNGLRVLVSKKHANKVYYGKYMWKWRITVLKSKKKNLRIQTYPDTCGRGLSLVFNESERFWNSDMASVYKPLVRPENVQTEDMIDITPIPTALLAVHRK